MIILVKRVASSLDFEVFVSVFQGNVLTSLVVSVFR